MSHKNSNTKKRAAGKVARFAVGPVAGFENVSRRGGDKAAPLPIVTPEQVRAILESEEVKASVKSKLHSLVGVMHTATTDGTLDDSAALTAGVFAYVAPVVLGETKGKPGEPAESREAYEKIAALVAEHEPEEYRVARRVVELYEAEESRGGAIYLIEHADDVMGASGEGLAPNPDSKFFPLIFVSAVREIGRDHASYIKLKDLLAQVDAGADLAALAPEYDDLGRAR